MTTELLQEELRKSKAALAEAQDSIARLNEEMDRLKNSDAHTEAEHALADANNRFKELITNLQNGIFFVDENRKIVVVNEMFCKQFGIVVPPEALIGTDGATITAQIRSLFKDQEEYKIRVDQIIKERKKVLKDELELVTGQTFLRDFIPVFYHGQYRGHLWKFTDITRNKTIEATFESQRLFYEQILNNIPADIIVCTPEYSYLYLNPMAVNDAGLRKWMIGKTNEEYCSRTNRAPSVAEKRRAFFNTVVTSKRENEWEEELVENDGTKSYFLRKMYPVLDNRGFVDMVIGYGVDITERKRIEQQVKVSEKRYRDIFSFSQAWICTHDMGGHILTINAAACKLLEREEHELVGHAIASFMPDKVSALFTDSYLSTIIKDGKAEGIMSVLSSTGKKIYLLYQNFLVKEPGIDPYVIGFAQNITERVHMEEALKRSEEKYRGIIENMNLGMIEIDTDESIIYANQRFCTMSEYALEELIGKKATDLFLRGTRVKRVSDHISKRAYGLNTSYELEIKTKSGEDKWWLVSAAPVFNSDKTQKGTIGIHLNITQQKKMEQQLREAKQDTDRVAKSKDIFLTNMSHEIRTPLNAIMGLGKLLSKSAMDAIQRNYLTGIESASENLLGIVNDLLDFSKMEAGKITIENISFNLDVVSSQLMNILSHKAEEKGLVFSHEIDERIAPMLIGDPYRINQVFTNMLSNAIKFTEKGSVSLIATLEGENKEENTQSVLVTIRDTGVGIKEEYIDQIFDKFTQEDETVVRKFGGTGLGMSITRQLMELMGGSIQVKSKKNEGTSILLKFHFKIGTARVLEKKRTIKNDTSNITGKRILLVEDNNLNRLLANTILKEYGAIVVEAVNGVEAIEAMKRETFDIVLMDIQMPVMDGVQATQIIRKELNSRIPVIALTANAIRGKLEQFLDAGMDDFIYKPYDEIKLVNPIAKWIGKQSEAIVSSKDHKPATNAAADIPAESVFASPAKSIVITDTEPAIAPASTPVPSLYDLTKLKNIGRNDPVFITKMVQLFVDELPPAVNKIKESFDTGDIETIKYLGHRIKPSILNMGIDSLKADILKIESPENNALTPELSILINKLHRVIMAAIEQLKVEYHL